MGYTSETSGQVILARKLLKNLKHELDIEADDDNWIITIYPEGTFKSIGGVWKASASEDLSDALSKIIADFILTINDDED